MENEYDGQDNLCLGLLLILGLLNFLGGIFFNTDWHYFYSVCIIFIISFFYFVYYIFKSGQIYNIIGNILLAIVVMAIATVVPVIGWLVLLVFVIYNIVQSIISIKYLFVDAVLTLILYFILVAPAVLDLIDYSDNFYNVNNIIVNAVAFVAYFIVLTIFVERIKQENIDQENVFFRFSIAFLSSGLIVITIVTIFSSIRNMFNLHVSSVQTQVKTPQNVSGYTTQSGTTVGGYTRHVTKTVTQNVGQIGVGTGAMSSAAMKGVGNTVNDDDNDNN